jgi:chloramphenicol 3-O-phosphotransferase
VSSSGKSTIARQLLTDLETPWFHMGVDMFGAMRAEHSTHELDTVGIEEVLRRCAVGELERRERIRGDRAVGTAAEQIDLVHPDKV